MNLEKYVSPYESEDPRDVNRMRGLYRDAVTRAHNILDGLVECFGTEEIQLWNEAQRLLFDAETLRRRFQEFHDDVIDDGVPYIQNLRAQFKPRMAFAPPDVSAAEEVASHLRRHYPQLLPQAERLCRKRDATAIRMFVRASNSWGLTDAEAAQLFDVPESTWAEMKAETFTRDLDQDNITRASLIVGIFRVLAVLFSGDMVRGWPKAPNTGSIFQGDRPVDLMIKGGIPAMLQIRRYLDGLRQGL